ncbi:hypothetical protein K438DRAFT_130799 [Mycena galopus ATCC 62051]|nr:hypothetical protein K438DRAFT_130799 [Mycena galopus ATCC 62051]
MIITSGANSSTPVARDAGSSDRLALVLVFLLLAYLVACAVFVALKHLTRHSLRHALLNLDGSTLRTLLPRFARQIERRPPIPLQPMDRSQSQALQVPSLALTDAGPSPSPAEPPEENDNTPCSSMPDSFSLTAPRTRVRTPSLLRQLPGRMPPSQFLRLQLGAGCQPGRRRPRQ